MTALGQDIEFQPTAKRLAQAASRGAVSPAHKGGDDQGRGARPPRQPPARTQADFAPSLWPAGNYYATAHQQPATLFALRLSRVSASCSREPVGRKGSVTEGMRQARSAWSLKTRRNFSWALSWSLRGTRGQGRVEKRQLQPTASQECRPAPWLGDYAGLYVTSQNPRRPRGSDSLAIGAVPSSPGIQANQTP